MYLLLFQSRSSEEPHAPSSESPFHSPRIPRWGRGEHTPPSHGSQQDPLPPEPREDSANIPQVQLPNVFILPETAGRAEAGADISGADLQAKHTITKLLRYQQRFFGESRLRTPGVFQVSFESKPAFPDCVQDDQNREDEPQNDFD
jgi:hypothetical protein